MKRIPTVKTVMTPFPYSIDADADLADAMRMMEEHEIQHLPVMADGELFGLIWDRDIGVIQTLGHPPEQRVVVRQVVNRTPYIVALDDRLDHVVQQMAERRVGAAVVMRGHKLAGILTSTDVCRLLADVLRADAYTPNGDDVA